jgi:hypothetical protein
MAVLIFQFILISISVHMARCWQVLWSYGSRCNDDFLVYHGFCLDNNPDEDIILFADVSEAVSWTVNELHRLGLLKGYSQANNLVGSWDTAASLPVVAVSSPTAIPSVTSSATTNGRYQECIGNASGYSTSGRSTGTRSSSELTVPMLVEMGGEACCHSMICGRVENKVVPPVSYLQLQ